MKIVRNLFVSLILLFITGEAEAKSTSAFDCFFKIQMTLPCGAVYEDCQPWTYTQQQELWKTWVRYTKVFCPAEEILPPA